MKNGLIHLARTGLLGFIALFTVGALIVAEQTQRPGLADAPEKSGVGAVYALGLVGALTAIVTVAILWRLFPVGPASKIVIGIVCGPFVPLILLLPRNLHAGKAGDLAGLVVIGMLIGALSGLLEANRIVMERRRALE